MGVTRKGISGGMLVGILLALLSAPVAGQGTPDCPCATAKPIGLHDVEQGSLLLQTDQPGAFVPAPALSTDVRMVVTGMIVRAEVTQRFLNPAAMWVEGVYVFPLPATAAVDSMRMLVGGRIIEGQIQEREEARRRYEQAKISGRRASLVEQERPNIFTTSVANIGPDEIIEVEISYQQTLRYDSDEFRLRLPLVVAPRYVSGGGECSGSDGAAAGEVVAVPDASRITPPIAPPGDGLHNPVTLMIDLDPGFPLKWVYSPSHAITTRDAGSWKTEITLKEGVAPANRDFVLVWAPEIGTSPEAALFAQELGGETYGLLMVMPPEAEGAELPRLPRETVFVIDTSSSMHGASLQQAKLALLIALDGLQAEDRFNVIQFNSVTSSLFPQPRHATPDALLEAQAYVDGLRPDGGTNMLPALAEALAGELEDDHLGQVIFITDGAVGNEAQLFDRIARDLGDRRLFTVGIGSAPNSHFMRKAARFGRGTFTYIGNQDEVSIAMNGLFQKLERARLTNIDVHWPDPDAEVWPEQSPDLYAGEPVIVVARLRERLRDLGGEVVVSGYRGDEPWEVSFPIDELTPDSGIDKLWAREKISSLMDSLHDGVDRDTVHRAVVELALTHHLVSKYTSLVAVDVTPSAPSGELPQTQRIPVNLPHGWPGNQVLGTLPQGATPAQLYLLLGLSLLACALLVRRYAATAC